MKFLGDFHIHTIASNHAYSTFMDIVRFAAQKEIEYIGIADHGPKMLDGPHKYYFSNLVVIPEIVEGVKIKKGIELNILDETGSTDFDEQAFRKLDYAIASFHDVVSPLGLTADDYTSILEKVVRKKYVKVIGHPGNPKFPVHIPEFVALCKANEVAIEINNSSFLYTRKGSYDNCLAIAKEAVHQQADILLSSDAHFHYDICNFSKAQEIIELAQIPTDLIINCQADKIRQYFGGTPS